MSQKKIKKNQKNQKNEKSSHIVLLCHIVTIQVDKQVVATFIQHIHAYKVISQNLTKSRRSFKGEEKWLIFMYLM